MRQARTARIVSVDRRRDRVKIVICYLPARAVGRYRVVSQLVRRADASDREAVPGPGAAEWLPS
jgi:hypothetical protein